MPVDGRVAHAQRPGHVHDGRLGRAEPPDDVLGRGQDPIAGERGVRGGMWTSRPVDPAREISASPPTAAAAGGDPVQLRQGLRRQRQLPGGQVLAEVGERRRAGDQQDVGRPVQQPRQRDLHRRGPEPARDVRQRGRLQRREPAEREERHVGDALPGQVVDQGVVVAVGQVVVVLHAHDVGDRLRLGHLGGRDVAQADVADQPLALEVGQHRHLLGDGPLLGAVARPHHAVVDDVERVQAEVAEVVVDAGGQVLGRDGRLPRPVRRAAGPELGDDHQPRRVRVQGLPDDLVGDVRAVVSRTCRCGSRRPRRPRGGRRRPRPGPWAAPTRRGRPAASRRSRSGGPSMTCRGT